MISHRKSFEKSLFGEKLLHYVDQKPVFGSQNLNAARRDKACGHFVLGAFDKYTWQPY